jgi:type III pantothenate kinase
MILPGLSLMQQSLAQGTAQLPAVAEVAFTHFPTDTFTAIHSGCVVAQCGAVSQFVQNGAQENWIPQRALLCGGAAQALASQLHLACPIEIQENLVLEGVYVHLLSAYV